MRSTSITTRAPADPFAQKLRAQKRPATRQRPLLPTPYSLLPLHCHSPNSFAYSFSLLITACAAASRAIGTRNGEQLT